MAPRYEPSDADSHVLLLGQIVGNLQSLEAFLRVYLEVAEGGTLEATEPFLRLRVGMRLPETRLTDYSALGQLVDDFNTRVPRQLQISRKVVEIRDAIAHGRLLSPISLRPLQLVKFDRPAGGLARVSMVAEMTDGWLTSQRKLVFNQIVKVRSAYDRLGVAVSSSALDPDATL